VPVDRQEAALIEAVCRDADNDAPRRAYADWLARRAEPALVGRGRFIRVQCRLARLRSQGAVAQRLRREQASLLRLHGEAWRRREFPEAAYRADGVVLPPYRPPDPRRYTGPYERGFSTEIRLSWRGKEPPPYFTGKGQTPGRCADYLSDFLRVGPWRKLSWLHYTWGIGAAFARTPHAASLRVLWIQSDTQDVLYAPFAAEDADALWRTPHLSGLEEVRIEGYRLGSAGVAPLAEAGHLRSLRKLSVASLCLGDAGVEALLRFPHLNRLETLMLDDNRLSRAAGRMLADAPGLAQVQKLSLWFNPRLERDADTVRLLRRRFGRRVRFTPAPASPGRARG
jgi:uncharacterized protein (TIGR02996 family)